MRVPKMMVFLLILILTGCATQVVTNLGDVGTPAITDQYRFGSFDSNVDEIKLIDSFSDFEEFLSKSDPGEEKSNILLNLYNENFFKDNVLYAVEIMVSSGSTKVTAEKIEVKGKDLFLHVKLSTPEIGTTDIANWVCLFGVDRETSKATQTVELVKNR